MVEGRRPAGGKASSNARPGLSAGYGVPPKLRACGLGVHGPPKPRTSIALDLRQEPGAGKPHAGICAGGPGQPGPLPLHVSRGLLSCCGTRRSAITPSAGILTVSDGTHTANVQFTGDYTTAIFPLAPDNHTWSLISFVKCRFPLKRLRCILDELRRRS